MPNHALFCQFFRNLQNFLLTKAEVEDKNIATVEYFDLIFII